MPFNPDDPRYTAYFLGEVGESERAAIDAELKADSAAAAAISEIRATTLRLSAALQAEPLPMPAATGSANAAPAGEIGVAIDLKRKPARRLSSWKVAIGALVAIAGCGLAAVVMLPATNNFRESSRIVATNQMHQVDVGLMNTEDKRKMNGDEANARYDRVQDREGINGAFREADERSGWNGGTSGPSPSERIAINGGTLTKNLGGTLTLSGSNSYTAGTNVTAGATNVSGRNDQYGFAIKPHGMVDGTSNTKLSIAGDQPHFYNKASTGNEANAPAVRGLFATGQAPPHDGPYAPTPPFGFIAGESEFNTESYALLEDNRFLTAAKNELSTFSIDVDTASYSNIRRFLLQQNQLPPPGAVRIEEMINYFRYEYPQPEGDKPFSVTTEVASCPWAAEHRLVRIGLKGRDLEKRPPSNLVFLIDVSGSMEMPAKLPLVQASLKMLTEQLGANDHVAIVVYAGNSGLVLPSTRGDEHEKIINAIERLRAGGSTNGGQGIELAYEIACQNILKGGVNRVILATDGDFNVGVTNQDALVKLIQDKAKTGVFLTALGFGYGNLKDSTMQMLADKGNGNNYYIDDLAEARKVLVEQIGGTLVTIAKDVKIQIDFNPAEVASYRLIGYEKRILAKEDFNDDKKDAGEIGAGHTVTALYEIVPADGRTEQGAERVEKEGAKSEEAAQTAADPDVDPLKYQKPASLSDAAKTGELFTLKLRYKQPDGDKSTLMETPVKDAGAKYGQASPDFKFAAAVASFGMILRDSPYKGNTTLSAVKELAQEGVGKDGEKSDSTYRAEFVQLVERANSLKGP
jgi:Ca-activated chloride channel family protein